LRGGHVGSVADSTRLSPELGLRPEVDTQERQDLADCLARCLGVVEKSERVGCNSAPL
jgi:hypothetical protein